MTLKSSKKDNQLVTRTVSTQTAMEERNACFLMLIYILRDILMVLEKVERSHLFKKHLRGKKAGNYNENRRSTLLICQKKINLLRKFVDVPIQSTIFTGKKCSISMSKTKYLKILETCIVQHVKTKSVFTYQPMKPLFSTTVKSGIMKIGYHVLNIPSKE